MKASLKLHRFHFYKMERNGRGEGDFSGVIAGIYSKKQLLGFRVPLFMR